MALSNPFMKYDITSGLSSTVRHIREQQALSQERLREFESAIRQQSNLPGSSGGVANDPIRVFKDSPAIRPSHKPTPNTYREELQQETDKWLNAR